MQTITEHNVETNEVTQRPMTEIELANWEKLQESAIQAAEEKAARAVARQALLDKLGITADEARLLLG